MVMKGMSERAYAAKSGLSRGAVQKARKTGRLVLYPDGSINVAASDIRRSAMTDPDQQMRARGGFGAGGATTSLANTMTGTRISVVHMSAIVMTNAHVNVAPNATPKNGSHRVIDHRYSAHRRTQKRGDQTGDDRPNRHGNGRPSV